MFRTALFCSLLTACAPLEVTDLSADANALQGSEEAYPNARVEREAETVVVLPDNEEVVMPYAVQNGHVVVGGDMDLGPVEEFEGQDRAAVVRNWFQPWDTCEIAYSIDEDLSITARLDFEVAVNHWQMNTGLRFIEDDTAEDRILVEDSSGCSSHLGMKGGVQKLKLNQACGYGGAIHEIGHAVGLLHEHTRRDRDDHVEVNESNIQFPKRSNFARYFPVVGWGRDVGAYDVDSVMQYQSDAFLRDGRVCHPGDTSGCAITTKEGEYIGRRRVLSDGDIAGIAELYPNCGGTITDDHGDEADEATSSDGEGTGELTPTDVDWFEIVPSQGDWIQVDVISDEAVRVELHQQGEVVTAQEGTSFAMAVEHGHAPLRIRVSGAVTTYAFSSSYGWF